MLYRRWMLAAAVLAQVLVASQVEAQVGRQVRSDLTAAGPTSVRIYATGLDRPWGIAFLPDGRLLVTEKPGRLRVVDKEGKVSDPIPGLPEIYVEGQGGLLDVAVHPRFNENQFVYFSYVKAGPDNTSATALGRGRFVNDRIENFQELFVHEPWVPRGLHYGSRIVFNDKNQIFLTIGDRFQFQPAQDLNNHLGKVIRLNDDGSVPKDNPFVGRDGAKPEIWSLGHRNMQAAAIDPATGDLWVVEMGPLGGDELNKVEAGKNYGWPVVSWGINYDGTPIPNPDTRPEFTDAVRVWTPVISPSGMTFYTGDVFTEWKGSAFIGGLSSQALIRVKIENGRVVEEERIPLQTRIRDVQQGPDGYLYLIPDGPNSAIWQMRPLK